MHSYGQCHYRRYELAKNTPEQSNAASPRWKDIGTKGYSPPVQGQKQRDLVP